VGPTPIKARKAEEFLRGKKPDAANLAQAAELASQESQPSADLRGPVEYKVGLARELTKRALALAVERAGK
jgi:carbon-monoxide dehydrogenase medium subunit